MNIGLYKHIFSKRLNKLVVVGGNASSISHAGASRLTSSIGPALTGVSIYIARLTFAAATTFLFAQSFDALAAPAVNALPSGAQVAAGNVAINKSGNTLTINQTSNQAIVNWNSFNIGANAKVVINQPGANSVQLDRVTGNSPSQIFGQLTSNGQVILVNPNGIVFGKDGSVSASSFTASTLGITDADFLAGNYKYSRNGSTGEVLNQGSIQASSGGYVALLGAGVTNDGKIIAPQGSAYLGAAEAITVPVSSSGRIKLELSPSSINAAVTNTVNGTIVAEGGQVFMQAAALNDAAASSVSAVSNAGSIDVSGAKAGNVTLLSDKGSIAVSGSISANSTNPNNAGGNIVIGRDADTGILSATSDVSGATLTAKGGLIETSGEVLKSDGVKIQSAQWLLDPNNVEINAGSSTTPTTVGDSVVLASAINTALNAGTSVVIATGASGSTNASSSTAITGTGTQGAGNILVNGAINGTGSAGLTLNAANQIQINNNITTGGSQLYSGAVVLGANTTLTANNNASILFGSTVDSVGATPFSLSLVNPGGASIFTGAVGSVHPLASLATSTGTTSIGANVTTTGAQSYGGNLNLIANNLSLNTGNSNVSVAGLINSGSVSGNSNSIFQMLGNGSFSYNGATFTDTGSAAYSNIGIGGLSLTWNGANYSFTSNANSALSYLLVGGGGGGGSNWGGGGGGGQVLAGTGSLTTTGTYTFVVGAGGQGAVAGSVLAGSRGVTTSANLAGTALSAIGGGGGGTGGGGAATTGASGGGGAGNTSSPGASGTTGAGYAGYAGWNGWGGGGGGGAGGNGTANGGVGLASSITGATVYYGAGGGAGSHANTGGGLGGSSGAGGAGGFDNGVTPTSAQKSLFPYAGGNGVTAGSGGGGGSGWNGAGGNGANGLAVLAYGGTSSGSTLSINSGTGTIAISGGATNLNNLALNSSATGAAASSITGPITGAGSLTQAGSGTTVLTGANTYTGGTTVSGGTLQVGNGSTSGRNGSLGSGRVALSNGATLSYQNNTNTSISNAITGAGNVIANITGALSIGSGGINLSGTSSVTPTINLTSTGAITQTGSLGIDNASSSNAAISLTTTGSSISVASITGSNGSRPGAVNVMVESNGGQISALGAIATGGNVLLDNTGGQFNPSGAFSAGNMKAIGAGIVVNNQGINASGIVNIFGASQDANAVTIQSGSSIQGASLNISGATNFTDSFNSNYLGANYWGVGILSNIKSTNGAVNIYGQANNAVTNKFGVYVGGVGSITSTGGVAKVTGVTATASNNPVALSGGPSAYAEGTYSLGAISSTDNAVNISGSVTGSGNSRGADIAGAVSASQGIAIVGVGTQIGIGALVGGNNTITANSGTPAGNNAVLISGSTANNGGTDVYLNGTTIANNSAGNVTLQGAGGLIKSPGDISADKIISSSSSGQVQVLAGTDQSSGGLSTGSLNLTHLTITQNSNAGVLISSTGQGNILGPNVINNGSGNVVVAAGTQLAAGNGSGGQVLTSPANSIAMNHGGTLYVYSGNANSTGNLGLLNSNTANLVTAGAGLNTQFNSAFGDSVNGGSTSAQVLFRDATALPFSVIVGNTHKLSGATDPALSVVSASTSNGSTLAMDANGNVSTTLGNNNFSANTKAVVAALNLVRNPGETAGAYTYNSYVGGKFGIKLIGNPTLTISTLPVVPPNVVTPTSSAVSKKTANSDAGQFTTASLDDPAEACSLDGLTADPEKNQSQKSSCTCTQSEKPGVDICFQS